MRARAVLFRATIAVFISAPPLGFSADHAQAKRDDSHVIAFVDQTKSNATRISPSPSSQTVDVSVGPGLAFSPSTVNIVAGDTVRWTWNGSNHTVTSGTPCTVDSQYCSTNNTNCTTAATSNSGTVYTHTFTQAGTFRYFCRIHCGSGMTGTVNVAAPFVIITSLTRAANGHFIILGQTLPNVSVTIEFSPDLVTPFGAFTPPATPTAGATGAFQFDDAGAVGLPMRFYHASYP